MKNKSIRNFQFPLQVDNIYILQTCTSTNAMNDQTQTHKRKRINYDGQQESIINNENLRIICKLVYISKCFEWPNSYPHKEKESTMDNKKVS